MPEIIASSGHHSSTHKHLNNDFNVIVGCVMAIFAAIAAITIVIGTKSANFWLHTSQNAEGLYSWYQAKSIKETLETGERNLLKSLQKSLTLDAQQQHLLILYISELDKNIARLQQEKKEILKGSHASEKPLQEDIYGRVGALKGATQWELESKKYQKASDTLDYASIFLHFSLVLGAISLIVNIKIPRYLFFFGMIILGFYGSYYAWAGYQILKCV